MSFWQNLHAQGPIIGLSPMDGVTDMAMRYMVARHGRAKAPNPKHQILNKFKILNSNKQAETVRGGVDVIFTEFVSVDALRHAQGKPSWERVIRPLKYSEIERPVVAQVFGQDPELFAEAAELIESLGFDGLDINMGCPVKKVAERGSGAGLIRTPELAQKIVRAAKAATKLPVSVKTRVGVESVSEMEEWISALVEVEPAAISLHGRTLKQLYTGRADWEAIRRAAEIVHKNNGIILGNGDIGSVISAQKVVGKYGVDGVLIGRASFGNPGIFVGIDEPSLEQRFAWMMEHARVYEELLGTEHFEPMRKHLAWYSRGFPGASEVRSKLVRCNSASEVEEVVYELD